MVVEEAEKNRREQTSEHMKLMAMAIEKAIGGKEEAQFFDRELKQYTG